MDIRRKDVLNSIKKLMESQIMDPEEIKWFRYIMNYIKEYEIFGQTVWIIHFDNEDHPLDSYQFRKFLEDYRRDNCDKDNL